MRKSVTIYCFFLLLISGILVNFNLSAQTVRYVPGQYATIPDAVSVAFSGDIIDITGNMSQPQIAVNKSLTFRGHGAGNTVVSSSNPGSSFSVFEITTSANVFFTDMTIKGGYHGIFVNITGPNITVQNCEIISNFNWGIYFRGTKTCYANISNSTINNNSRGIYNTGTMTIKNCNICNNYNSTTTWNFGGGIDNTGKMTIENSTISNNTINGGTWVLGGGIHSSGTSITITNSTISNNAVIGGTWSEGGGIFSDDTISVNNCTIYNNSITSTGNFKYGAGIYTSKMLKMKNTILADNIKNGVHNDDYYWASGTILSLGYNLLGQNPANAFNATGDLTGKNPALDNLKNNGGYTLTHALLSGSAAINAGSNTDISFNPVLIDQRGYSRVSPNDIGAYEKDAPYNIVKQITDNICNDFQNQPVIRIEITVPGPWQVTSFTFNTTGTTNNAEIQKAKLFYTGTANLFSTVNQFGTAVNSPIGNFSMNDAVSLIPGTNYFWLAYDISDTASIGHLFDAMCFQLNLNGSITFPDSASPYSARKLIRLKADFLINDSDQCKNGNLFSLFNNTSISSGSYTNTWEFGDMQYSTVKSPAYTYSNPGSYNIILNVSSGSYCSSSITKPVIVYPSPGTQFTINDSIQCIQSNMFSFSNNSNISTGSIVKQKWTFGDGTQDTNLNASHSYSKTGTYQVILRTYSDKGCKDSLIKNIHVVPMPKSDFVIYDSAQCLERNNFGFINKSRSASSSLTHFWDFGDFQSSVQENPSHQYLFADTFTVKLLVTDTFGCKDSITKKTFVHVHPEPLASFGINDSLQCLGGNLLTFSNNSSIKSGSITPLWDFGDHSGSGVTSPVHSYSYDDTFDVKLLVISDKACKDSIIKKVIIRPMPVSQFRINDTSQCINANSYVFINRSSYPLKGKGTYIWAFGDGTTDTAEHPLHHYSKADTFNVRLISSFDIGCSDTSTVNVYVNPKPIPQFNINDFYHCKLNNHFIYQNSSIISGDSIKYFWNLGNGVLSKNTDTVSQHYFDSGSYYISLKVTADYGCIDSVIKTISVHPEPVADFTINNRMQCFLTNHFIFTNKSFQPFIKNQTYIWDFGDGITNSDTNTTHIYAADTFYQVRLTVISDKNCIDSITKSVVVSPPPTTSFTVTSTGNCVNRNNLTYSYNSPSYPQVMTVKWAFSNNDSFNNSTPVPGPNGDTFYIKLIAITNVGCVDSSIQKVVMSPVPKTSFIVSDSIQCMQGNQFHYTNLSVCPKTGGSPPYTCNYLWEFGDGGTDTNFNTVHSYIKQDSFKVKLTTVSNLGCRDSMYKTVKLISAPVSVFSVADSIQCLNGNNFTFSNLGITNNPLNTKYKWYFGDGNTDTSINPIHSYALDSKYTVSLVAEFTALCRDSLSKTLEVLPSPMADYSVNKNPQYLKGNKFIFSNLSNGGTNPSLSYLWDFGDSDTSSSKNPIHTYKNAGDYSVRLIATTGGGCSDTITKLMKIILAVIKTDFKTKDVCLGDTAFFTNNSTVSNDSFISFFWDFGDGNTKNIMNNTSHLYQNSGNFIINLISTTFSGLKDTVNGWIRIYPKPSLSITYDPDTLIEKGLSVTLTASGIFDSIFWSTGEKTATIEVNAAGNYVVRAVNYYGCSTTEGINIFITEEKPFRAFNALTPNGDGRNDFWIIENISKYQPCKVAITNRWGDLLYTSDNYQNNWEGTYKGKPLPEGTYYYFLETSDGTVHKGAINILK
jgi:gliding motility-associated-like protein